MTNGGPVIETPRAITILLDEHLVAHEYIDPLEELSGPLASLSAEAIQASVGLIGRALAFLEDELEEHIEKEEEPLFARMDGRMPPEDSALIDEMLAEHDQIRIHRDQLLEIVGSVLHDGHDDVRERRNELREALDAYVAGGDPGSFTAVAHAAAKIAAICLIHFENEENFVFPLAPVILASDELDLAAAEMDAIAQRYAAHRSGPVQSADRC